MQEKSNFDETDQRRYRAANLAQSQTESVFYKHRADSNTEREPNLAAIIPLQVSRQIGFDLLGFTDKTELIGFL